ncbi:hypothetical protein Efla_004391 [Eimeria flavescens]
MMQAVVAVVLVWQRTSLESAATTECAPSTVRQDARRTCITRLPWVYFMGDYLVAFSVKCFGYVKEVRIGSPQMPSPSDDHGP